MTNLFFEKPIINSPYEIPSKHWELDKSGQPTQNLIDGRRSAKFITPIPKAKKQTLLAEILKNEGVSARVVNMSTIKPIDSELLKKCAVETGAFVTAEDHNVIGGLGGAVAESLAKNKPAPVEFIGVQDMFGESGEPDELADKYEQSAEFIVIAAKKAIIRKNKD